MRLLEALTNEFGESVVFSVRFLGVFRGLSPFKMREKRKDGFSLCFTERLYFTLVL